MAVLVASSAFDMEGLLAAGSLSEFFEFGEVVTATDTLFVVAYSDEATSEQLTLTGTFGDYVDGYPTTGTVTGTAFALNGSDLFSVTGMAMSVADFTAYAQADDLAGLFQDALSGNDELYGSTGDDTLYGFAGDDTLRGDAGADALYGGDGNDFLSEYAGDTGPYDNDIYDGGAGNDRVSLFTTYGPGVTVDLRISGPQDTGTMGVDTFVSIEHITSNYGDDTLTGNDAANWFWTFGGFDMVYGNGGNDYFTFGIHDKIADGGTGIDTVDIYDDAFEPAYNADGITVSLALQGAAQWIGTANWTLSNIENLGGWYGSDEFTGDGNANILAGGEGDDTLIGGGGNDILSGDGAFDMGENAVPAFLYNDTTVGNWEGWAFGNDSLEGGEGDDQLFGHAGDDELRGGTGSDEHYGGDGNDFMAEASGIGPFGDDIYDGGAGIDRVSYYGDALSAITIDLRVETAQDTGRGVDTLVGVEHVTADYGDDTLIGTAADNWFWTFSGFDQLTGNEGNDYFTVGRDDKVIAGGTGIDSVEILDLAYEPLYTAEGITVSLALQGQAQATGAGNWTLTGIENLFGSYGSDELTGDGNANRLGGGEGDDTLVGGAGNDILAGDGTIGIDSISGGAGPIAYYDSPDWEGWVSGNDVLDGGAGSDTMLGGRGDDTYHVDSTGDVVIEAAGEGIDTIVASYAYVLGAELENLTLAGSASISGTGNALGNTIIGNNANNFINGAAGADVMAGGGGNDTFVVDNAGDVVTEAAGEGIDTVRSDVSFTLGANIENMLLTGAGFSSGTGNDLGNTIIGNSANNLLDGGAGSDSLRGGGGNDTYVVDTTGDVIVEFADAGIDTVRTSADYRLGSNVENMVLLGTAVFATGNDLDNTILGNASNNFLNGDSGADSMRGGDGNDTYVVDDAGDVVVEFANNGTDTVRTYFDYRLGSNVENMVLLGTAVVATGNDLANTILGTAGNNFINGDAGADSMRGGGGNDTYVVDDTGDVIIEFANAGVDTVRSYFDYRIGSNVENMVLLGTAVVGTGNSASNIIIGTEGRNFLNGAAGADSLRGGAGNDTYVLDNAGDSVIETFGAGTDTVRTYVDHSLQANVENMVLIGAAEINGTGNGDANTILGNDVANTIWGVDGNDSLRGLGGDDTLVGGNGNDSLLGGNGGDSFVFDATLNASTNVDEIRDFSSGEGDDIVLDQSVFAALDLGALPASAFHAGTAAADADDRIVYDSATGSIYYDADGNGAGEQVLFATVTAGTSLTNADFFVIA